MICSRDQILELYARCEAAEESSVYRPYREILRSVTRRMANEFGIHPSEHELHTIEESLPRWLPFGDSVEALKRLKKRFRLAVISNIDDDLFRGSAERLKVPFDFVTTAAQVRAYKPSPVVFEQAQARMEIDKAHWLHVAQSKFHDIAPAGEIGLQTVWVNRRHAQPGFGATPESAAIPTMEVPDLTSLADYLLA